MQSHFFTTFCVAAKVMKECLVNRDPVADVFQSGLHVRLNLFQLSVQTILFAPRFIEIIRPKQRTNPYGAKPESTVQFATIKGRLVGLPQQIIDANPMPTAQSIKKTSPSVNSYLARENEYSIKFGDPLFQSVLTYEPVTRIGEVQSL